MNNIKRLAATFTGAAAIAALFTLSASAETRHRDETNVVDRGATHGNDSWRANNGQSTTTTSTATRANEQNYRGDLRNSNRNYDRSTKTNDQRGDRNYGNNNRNTDRNYDRNNGTRNTDRNNGTRNYDRNNGTRNYDPNNGTRNYDRNNNSRNYDRNRGNDRNYNNRSYDRHDAVRYDNRGRRSFDGYGRVNRIVHEGGGYRIWLDGGRYPYWVPEARWRAFPLRLGLSIRIGGWLDPLGYVDAYDIGPYGGGPVYTSGQLHGVVESVDFGRGTLVLRDDVSGNFVTAVMRDGRMDNLREGDYVTLSGDWTRGGVFEAFRLDDVRDGY